MSIVKQFLYKDNLAFGVLLSLILSILVYAMLSAAAFYFPETFSSRFLRKQVLIIISIFVNLFPFRMYMAGLKFEKTGRGILAAIFVMMILYFVFIHGNQA
jgi:hypothetical protein